MNDDIGEELIALSRHVDPTDMTERAYAGARRLGLRSAVLGVAVVVALLGGGVAGAVTLWPSGNTQQGPADDGDDCVTEDPTDEPAEEKPEDAGGMDEELKDTGGEPRLFDGPTDAGGMDEELTDEPTKDTEDPTEEPTEACEDPTEEPTEEPTEDKEHSEPPTEEVTEAPKED